MRYFLLIVVIVLVCINGCTDREAEELIEGHWYAVKMVEVESNDEHHLPDEFHLNFEYPKYNFEGTNLESGNFYIKNERLHLIPDHAPTTRDLRIQKLIGDSLILELQDSLGMRTVLFLKNERG